MYVQTRPEFKYVHRTEDWVVCGDYAVVSVSLQPQLFRNPASITLWSELAAVNPHSKAQEAPLFSHAAVPTISCPAMLQYSYAACELTLGASQIL